MASTGTNGRVSSSLAGFEQNVVDRIVVRSHRANQLTIASLVFCAIGVGLVIVAVHGHPTAVHAVPFLAGAALAQLPAYLTFVYQRRTRLYESLDRALLGLLACAIPMNEGPKSDPELFGRLIGALHDFDGVQLDPTSTHGADLRPNYGWLADAARSLDLELEPFRERTPEYQIRRLTAGIDRIVAMIPESDRNTSVPELAELGPNFGARVERLDQQIRGLDSLPDRVIEASGDAVREALTTTLLGPDPVNFSGWQIVTCHGPNGRIRPDADGFSVALAEPCFLEVRISTREPSGSEEIATPLGMVGKSDASAVNFRLDVRAPGLTVSRSSSVLRWDSAEGQLVRFEIQPRSVGRNPVYLTTYVGVRLVQTTRIMLEVSDAPSAI